VIKDIAYGLSRPGSVALVAENGIGVAGFIWGYRINDEKRALLKGSISDCTTYLDDVAVDASKRIRGVGSALVREFLARSAALGFTDSVLRTDINNAASMALFRSCGYVPVMRDDKPVFDPEYKTRIYLKVDL
jgi:ribosomal protein S18 acetylase RimI-like enzyme